MPAEYETGKSRLEMDREKDMCDLSMKCMSFFTKRVKKHYEDLKSMQNLCEHNQRPS